MFLICVVVEFWDSIHKKIVHQNISVEDIRDIAQVWFKILPIVVVLVGFGSVFDLMWTWFLNLILFDVGVLLQLRIVLKLKPSASVGHLCNVQQVIKVT